MSEAARNRLSGALFGLLILLGLAVLVQLRGGFIIEDDARYYTVIAENIARDGRSTFDRQVLTNGYHPVWMAVLVVMAKTIGLSDAAIVAVELLLTTAGVLLMLGVFRSSSLALRLGFVAVFAFLATPLVCRGMEISLFVFGFGLFAAVLDRFARNEAGPVALGLAAGLAIGARLDAAAFVLPLLLLVAGPRRALAPLAVMAGCGALYAGFNQWVFGIAFPVSGAIKSLGGVQLNHRFLIEFTRPLEASSLLAGAAMLLRSLAGKIALLSLLSALALPFAGRRAAPWLAGFVLGTALYFAKLTFGSSWVIWSWYGFPVFIGLFTLALAADAALAGRTQEPRLALVAGVLVVLACAGLIVRSNRNAIPPGGDFEDINRLAAGQLGALLKGERVAMGDRAGSFAHYYTGPVTQTEGLVNDREFLEVLKTKGDVKALLCQRDVRFMVSYQKDLGGYERVSVPVLRRALTQYDAPAVTLARKDEVARIFDLAKFDASRSDEGDSYLYVWRISDCPAR